jgi:hypothetical protein
MGALDDLARGPTESERPVTRPAPRLVVTVPGVTHVAPSSGTTLGVTVRNLGDEADLVELSFDGPEWAWLAPRRLRIAPGGSAQVRLSVAPPRRAEAGPSRLPYAVVARSLRHPDTSAVGESALVTTASTALSTVDLEPRAAAARGPARFVLSIVNDGDAAATAAVELIADSHLRQEAPATATVPAHGSVSLQLIVTPRRRRLARWRDHSFSVVVQVGADPPARLAATYRQLARVPAWLVVLLALAATVAILGLLSA